MSSWATRSTPTRLYEESGGNPFYLEQLARSADRVPRGTAARDETSPAAIGVPSIVAAALAEELALLSGPARLALEGAAVAGDPVRARAGRGRGRDCRSRR